MNVPKLSFKDDEGRDFREWEEKSSGDVLDYELPTKFLCLLLSTMQVMTHLYKLLV